MLPFAVYTTFSPWSTYIPLKTTATTHALLLVCTTLTPKVQGLNLFATSLTYVLMLAHESSKGKAFLVLGYSFFTARARLRILFFGHHYGAQFLNGFVMILDIIITWLTV